MSNKLVVNVDSKEELLQKIETKEITQSIKVQFNCICCGKHSIKGGRSLIRRPILTCTSCSNKESSKAYQSNEDAKRRRLASYKATMARKPKKSKVKSSLSHEEKMRIALEKRKQTNLKRYGLENTGGMNRKLETEEQKKSRIEKSRKTKLERYGNAGYGNPTKGKATKLERYGDANYNNQKLSKRKYLYDNIYFDSSWEIAFYIYLKDNQIAFEFHPDIFFKYDFNGKQHNYYPDFIVNNMPIELKGSQFFCNGTMINPFDRSQDELYKAKYNCMIKNHVKIISNNEIKPYIDYINRTYGRAFLKECRVHANK